MHDVIAIVTSRQGVAALHKTSAHLRCIIFALDRPPLPWKRHLGQNGL